MADRDFKGVWIPKEIWLDTRLNALEKIILAEIDSLDNGEDHCWKSNENIAKFCQCSTTKVSNAVSKLIELGYVKVASFDGRTRRLQSCLTISGSEPYKNCKADLQNLYTSNTYSNTESNTYNKENTSYSCSEPEESVSKPHEPAVISVPLNDGTEHPVTQTDIEKYTSLYPAVNVMQELRKMVGWLDGNPTRKKTRRGIKRFINGWLAREQDKGGLRPQAPTTQPQQNAFGLDRRTNKTPEKYGGGIVV